jgi:hypothetical protein
MQNTPPHDRHDLFDEEGPRGHILEVSDELEIILQRTPDGRLRFRWWIAPGSLTRWRPAGVA